MWQGIQSLILPELHSSECPLLERIKPHFLFGLKLKNLRKEYNWLSLGQVEMGPLIK